VMGAALRLPPAQRFRHKRINIHCGHQTHRYQPTLYQLPDQN
jgi:hypothetical protein